MLVFSWGKMLAVEIKQGNLEFDLCSLGNMGKSIALIGVAHSI